MPKFQTKISVIIPNYNYSDFIIERIDSILQQTYPIYELIVLDDASTDDSVSKIKEKIKAIEHSYPDIKIKFIANPKNSGSVFSQWQKGIQNATGEYLWIAEADDSCSSEFLSSIMKNIDSKIVIAYTDSKRINEYGNTLSDSCQDLVDIWHSGRWQTDYKNNGTDEIINYLSANNTIINVSSVVWKNIPQLIEIFESAKRFKIAGDWYIYSKVLRFGDILYLAQPLNYYRKHSQGSVSSTTSRKKEYKEVLAIQNEIKSQYKLSKDQIKYQIKRRRGTILLNQTISKYYSYTQKIIQLPQKVLRRLFGRLPQRPTKVTLPPTPPKSSPWLISFSKRKKILESAIDSGRRIALYLADKPDSSTFRYRCYNTFSAAKDSKNWCAIYFFACELDQIHEFLPKIDLFILARQYPPHSAIKDTLKEIKENKIPIILDLDDLLFDESYLDELLKAINDKFNPAYWRSYIKNVRALADFSDGFITTNDFLGSKMTQTLHKPYRVIINSLNSEQLLISSKCLDHKKHRYFTLGYFSGSPTHDNDLALIAPDLAKFLFAHPDAKLNIVGYMHLPKILKPHSTQIKFIPPVDFLELQRLMSEVDVNLAPLVDNIFTNCKSELKFFEAAAVETTTIASPTYTFKKAIQNKKTGFLCQPGEWYDVIEYLYQHPEENRKIAKNAREYCLGRYSGEAFLKNIKEVYGYFAK